MKKYLQALGISFLFLFLSFNLSFAKTPEEYNLPSQKTLPGSPTYVFKRIKEKLAMTIRPTSKLKYNYSKVLLEKRLSELSSLVNSKNPDQITSASQRFSYQAGIFADLNKKQKNRSWDDTAKLFERYNQTLSELRDNYPANRTNWLLLQQNIDTLKILLDEIK